MSSQEHSAMIAGGLPASFVRADEEVAHGEEGDELRAFGMIDPDGNAFFSLRARLLRVVPNRGAVMSRKNMAWDRALDPNDVTDLVSTVELTFASNAAGAEIRLAQSNVPHNKLRLPDSREVGALGEIVNTHWSLPYWEPMRAYFTNRRRSA